MVPRAQGRAGDPSGVDSFLEGHPAFFDRMAGQVAEEAVPSVTGRLVIALDSRCHHHPSPSHGALPCYLTGA